jgi:hypothetical protein
MPDGGHRRKETRTKRLRLSVYFSFIVLLRGTDLPAITYLVAMPVPHTREKRNGTDVSEEKKITLCKTGR